MNDLRHILDSDEADLDGRGYLQLIPRYTVRKWCRELLTRIERLERSGPVEPQAELRGNFKCPKCSNRIAAPYPRSNEQHPQCLKHNRPVTMRLQGLERRDGK